jgi:glycosyltransferase involved in cell wall biosynthesis
MKILNIANVAGIKRGGGVHEVAYNFWRIQNKIGYNSDLWFPGYKQEQLDLISDSGFDTVRALDTYFHPSTSLLKNFRMLLSEMNEYNIIHQHGIWVPISKLTLEANKNHKGIVIIQPHGYLEPYRLNISKFKKKLAYYFYEKNNIEQAKVLVACSNEEYLNLKNMFPSKDIAIIPNGISEEFYKHESKKDYFKNNKYSGRKNILFLSRIHPLKGLKRFLKVYADIDHKISKSWNIIIAGIDQDNHTVELKEIVNDLNLCQNVYFEGEKFNSDKVDIMSSANLFILPTYNENYGIVVAESLARGVPVLTTKGAPWSLLEKEKCGFWVDNSNNGIKNGLEKAMLLSEHDLKLMGENGRNIAKQYFLWDSIVHKTIELYKWLLDGGEKPDFIYLGDSQMKDENIFKKS